MDQAKKVSIITVTYNAAYTIEQTINSVLNQSYENIEYIIVDGLSTDGTWEKICKYKDRIKALVHEEDSGLYDAMNKGIGLATGEIVGIINGDDWYETDALSDAVKEFKDDVDVLYGKYNVIGYDNMVEHICSYVDIKDIWCDMVPHPTVFVRKQIYDKFGLFDLKYPIVADYELILRFYIRGARFRYVDKVLANFRRGGLTTGRWFECAGEVRKVSMLYINECPEKDKYIKKINERYSRALIRAAYEQSDSIFIDKIREAFCHKIDNICIFGAGIWGERCAGKLRRCNIPCRYFIDNNLEKHGDKICGCEIISPDRLRDMECSIIVAVGSGYDEISRQLEGLENPGLRWAGMFELYKE